MIQTSMTAGPMATAASVLGATAPTARPRADEQKDSSVRIPRNLRNLYEGVGVGVGGGEGGGGGGGYRTYSRKHKPCKAQAQGTMQGTKLGATAPIACADHLLFGPHLLGLGLSPVKG
jgi:hypothetical protein